MTNPIQHFYGFYGVIQKDAEGKFEDATFASNLEIDQEKQRVLWRDGGRGRLVDYAKISDLSIEMMPSPPAAAEKPLIARKITLLDTAHKCSYLFTPLTLDWYNLNLKSRLAGHQEFKTEEEMNIFFSRINNLQVS